jgi:hypothetical protein
MKKLTNYTYVFIQLFTLFVVVFPFFPDKLEIVIEIKRIGIVKIVFTILFFLIIFYSVLCYYYDKEKYELMYSKQRIIYYLILISIIIYMFY